MFVDKDVLDSGSLDINGNNRYLFEKCRYTGIDIGYGKNVDIKTMTHKFRPGKEYDVVMSTEQFEHDKYWRESAKRCVELTKQGGLFMFTCALEGRPEHGTEKNHPGTSPFSHKLFSNYYENRVAQDFKDLPWWKDAFVMSGFHENTDNLDLYFWGIKK